MQSGESPLWPQQKHRLVFEVFVDKISILIRHICKGWGAVLEEILTKDQSKCTDTGLVHVGIAIGLFALINCCKVRPQKPGNRLVGLDDIVLMDWSGCM